MRNEGLQFIQQEDRNLEEGLRGMPLSVRIYKS